jgi:hypothetical protein
MGRKGGICGMGCVSCGVEFGGVGGCNVRLEETVRGTHNSDGGVDEGLEGDDIGQLNGSIVV